MNGHSMCVVRICFFDKAHFSFVQTLDVNHQMPGLKAIQTTKGLIKSNTAKAVSFLNFTQHSS